MKIRAILVASVFILLPAPTWADAFEVAVDHAGVLHLSRPAVAVIVGNSAIADATVHNGQLLFITGKTFGATNFIAIDADGKTIINRDLQVLPSNSRLTLHRGGNQRSYLCSTGCEPVLGIGDDTETFDRILTQRTTKADEGTSAATQN
ncbi:MAG: pilus assembly protein N-terminal domain-containing protein [Robiginitomaculum sp.]|nr:pilus assembly protein N-terminal domain-containing protein [Robiginitomaculum sp.]